MKEYLMQHPTSMPLQEASMSYLFLYAAPVLTLVPPLPAGAEEEQPQEEEQQPRVASAGA